MVTEEILKSTIQSNFPYLIPFEGQLETVYEICHAFINEGKQHVILDAPTGSGKSVIAWTVIKTLSELNFIRRSSTITTTKALQNLYTTSFPEMKLLKSKVNYECPFGRGPYMSGECRVHVKVFGCKPREKCPYVQAREEWRFRAKHRNTNTAFMLEACGTLVKENECFTDFMVIDEVHRLEELIINHAHLEFFTRPFADVASVNSALPYQESHVSIIRLLNHLGAKSSSNKQKLVIVDQEIRELAAKVNYEVTETSEQILKYISVLNPEDNEDNRAIEFLSQLLLEISSIHNSAETLSKLGDGSRLHINISEGYLEVKVIDASVVSEDSLFSKGKKFLHMSGTVCGYNYHLEKLGINPELAKFIQVKNHIPVKNRIIHALGNFRIRSNDYEANKGAIEFVDKIIAHYKGKHGFIFCPSYDMCEVYYNHSKFKDRLVIPETMDEAAALMKEDNDKVLISPALIEGIDLKGDMCRFAVIPRIPYLYLGDDIVNIKWSTEPEFYYRTTIMKLVQVCGRGVRGIDDSCDTYILDSSMKILMERNSEYVPGWFKEAIKWYF